ncbi:membrane protein [Gigaspora margarita]|uniref:Membrane protein n=1 Tax=Gigaspora margarita TaxID=4874 RepID=A0A8H4AJ88_GIGMA|nr:membrane protein [Gigaspora margarita]
MSHLKGLNKTNNEGHIIRSLRESTSSLVLEPPAPSSVLEPPIPSTALEPSAPSTVLELKAPSITLESPEPSKLKTNNSTRKNKRRKMILLAILKIFVDVGLPLIFYYIFSNFVPVVWALFISGIPPMISVILNFIFRKQVNAMGILIMTSFIAGSICSIILNDPRLYLLRESFVGGIISMVFIISLIPINVGSFQMRPLLYYSIQHLGIGIKGLTEDEPIPERWERYWRSYVVFRRTFIVLTAVCLIYSKWMQKLHVKRRQKEEAVAAANNEP